MINPTPDHFKYRLSSSETRLLNVIGSLNRKGYMWSEIGSILHHAQYYAVSENLDLFDVIKGTRIKNCVGVIGSHSHKEDDGIAMIWNLTGGDSIEGE